MAPGPSGHPAADVAGAGAAGGVGFAAIAVLGATARPGIDLLLDADRVPAALDGADLVVTGEGSLDEQTLHGKAPAGVAAAARAAGVPVVAVAGRNLLSEGQLADAGVRTAYALVDVEPDVQRCIAEPGPLLEELGRRIGRDAIAAEPTPGVERSRRRNRAGQEVHRDSRFDLVFHAPARVLTRPARPREYRGARRTDRRRRTARHRTARGARRRAGRRTRCCFPAWSTRTCT